MHCMIHIQNHVYYQKFKYIQIYSRPIHVIFNLAVTYLELCVTLAYSEPCHIQNPGITRTQDKFRTLSRYILTYSERCVTPAYREPCHIKNFDMSRILEYLGHEAYSESFLFRHIQAYSDIFSNDSYNNIDFLFLALILHSFQWNLKRHMFFDYNSVNFNARLSQLKLYAIFKNSVIIE